MLNSKPLHIANRLGATCLAVLLLTTACGRPQKGGTNTGENGAANPLATPVNPTFPGPYKNVVIDGVEYKQGRFPQGTFGGTLVEPIIASDPKTFNVWNAEDSTSVRLGGLMWSTLLNTDPYTGDVIPEMAAEYTVDPDHVTYTTKLRKGLKWSDGKPITAEDVAFTFNTIVAKGLGNSSLRDVVSVAGKPPTVTVVDELTNKFVTAKPFAPFLRALGGIPIAPKHVLEPIVSGKDAQKKMQQLWAPTNIDTSTLVTSGPFVLSRFVPGQRVEFVRTKNYYMVDPQGKQLPYLDRIVFQFVPDVMANLLKFKGGETDITQVRNRDTSELAKDQQKNNFSLHNLGQDSGTIFLMFNMNQRKNSKGKPYVEPYKSAWFNDENFRQAISHALNRQQMVDGYLKGIGTPIYTGDAPYAVYFDKDLKPITQDVAYSLSLLEKSGFKKKPDGFLYDKDGNKVEFDVVYGAGGTMGEAVTGYIQEDLKKLGIKVNTQAIEFNTLIDKIQSSKDWQASLFSLTGDPLEPNNGANVWRSDGRLHLFDPRETGPDGKIVVNDARPWEKQIDDLFTEGSQEFDKDKRAKIYNQFNQIAYDQAPFIYLISPMDMVAARNTIKNFQPTRLSQTSWGLHNLDEIYMTGGADKK